MRSNPVEMHASAVSRRGGARLLLVLLTLCLAACGTISRDLGTAFRHSDALAALPAGAQILARQAPQDLALAERVPAQPPSERHAILALSGGGATAPMALASLSAGRKAEIDRNSTW